MFSEKEFEQVAKTVAIAPRSLKRLLGSILVQVVNPTSHESASEVRFDLGFRLQADRRQRYSPATILELERALAEFRAKCPLVFGWVTNGAFDPTKIPERVTYAKLLHANRTIGRLRAKVLRAQ